MDLSLPSARVIRSLEYIIEWRGKPSTIRLDNEPENIAQALVNWANKKQITKCIFNSVEQVHWLATQWLWLYNNERPNTAIGGVPPQSLLKAA